MISQYRVISYVPDPVIGERINVGVLVYGDGVTRCRFVQNWQRVKQFGYGDVAFLQDFAKEFEDRLSLPNPKKDNHDPDAINDDKLGVITRSWMNSIQISDANASTKTVEQLFEDVSTRFIREPASRKRRARDRRAAVSMAIRAVKAAVKDQIGPDLLEYVKRNESLQGQFDKHVFDVSVSNGMPYFAAQGLSFELPDTTDLRRRIDATAWAIDDVKKVLPNVPLSVIVISPVTPSEFYTRAVQVFEKLQATVIREEEVDSWASRMARTIDIPGPGH